MLSAKKRVVISACLLGESCRYDGKTKEASAVVKAFEGYEIIPFCPEAPLFGTPRERISVVTVAKEQRIITDETKKDVTQLLSTEIKKFIQNNEDVDAIVLKSKSLSCGYKTTPILNENKEILTYGNGIAASIFEQHYTNVKIQNELDFQ